MLFYGGGGDTRLHTEAEKLLFIQGFALFSVIE
jgi:hypothetical protein